MVQLLADLSYLNGKLFVAHNEYEGDAGGEVPSQSSSIMAEALPNAMVKYALRLLHTCMGCKHVDYASK